MKPNRMGFEKPYSDGSGVMYAVRLIEGFAEEREIEFECCAKLQFPVSEIEWLIDSLVFIRDFAELEPPNYEAVI